MSFPDNAKGISRHSAYNYVALLCALWFLIVGSIWTYYINIVVGYPVAILGFFLWRRGRTAENKKLNRVVGWLLMAGLILSIGILVALIVAN